MQEFFNYFTEASFMPHGHCYFWSPGILWPYAISDSIIALAYLVIPLSLVRIVRRRNDFTYMWMLGLFAVFILGCGTTHVFDVVNIWKPLYQYDVSVRIITALASIGTAITLVIITPKLILIPSAEQWKSMNEELRSLNETLEQKVEERTAELLQSAAQFEFLTDTIPQIVWTAKAKGAADYFNKNWYDYTGLDLEESRNDGWTSTIHPDDLEAFQLTWEESVNTGTSFQREFRLLNAADQTYRWHLARALCMKDNQGTVTKWFATATDIHDQRSQQEELTRINEELDNFVYTASHDLKAPISNLEGLLHLIYEKSTNSMSGKILELFKMMKSQVAKLREIIHDLSDVGRIQREAMENFEMIDVSKVFNEFQVTHREAIENTEAEIQANFREPQLYFSLRLFRSAMHNLLDNAIKYRSYERKPVINITTSQENSYFVLTVKDNGIGIEAEYLPKIFGMFMRFNQDRDGTGIGLYMVKRIAEKYQGKVEVNSQFGVGTEVKVYLMPPTSS